MFRTAEAAGVLAEKDGVSAQTQTLGFCLQVPPPHLLVQR